MCKRLRVVHVHVVVGVGANVKLTFFKNICFNTLFGKVLIDYTCPILTAVHEAYGDAEVGV